ncbi:anaphase-promoting complex subunit 1 [Chelonus insularis]|uniref:anaphase-promoting complex subunit 1 n=1 Tax=Chelonus insularis TaxID=460826 RepID=UPI001588BB85|nr:anaphase-promoting complex subunit 1 [Chelonus insularis]
MIAASDPLEFIPGGRRIYQRHPGTVIQRKNSANQPIQNDSILLQRLSQFNISERTPREFWIIRENVDCGEEELYCSGKVAVHTKGSPQTQVLQTSYCLESEIKHALWCNFCTDTPTLVDREKGKDKEDDYEKVDKTIESICLFDNYTLRVFTAEGEDYMSSLQFQISAVWATKYGILMEKSEVPLSRHTSLEISRWAGQNENSLPVAFSLTHPLDEICPVLIKHGGVNYMRDSNLKIVFTSTEPSLAVIYDTKTGLHSVYKIRKASSEERQVVCDTTSSIWNTSINASPLHVATSTSANKSSNAKAQMSLFGIPNHHMSSLGLGVSGSPFGSRGTSYTTSCSGGAPSPSPHQTAHSRSQSPMATISRCQSPTHPTFSSLISGSIGPMLHQTRLHQTAVTNMMCQSQHNPSSCNSMLFQDAQMPSSKPLYPEICLDHVWTEASGSQKDSIPDKASRVFLTTDLVGQGYLGYLVPCKSQLFLVRIEKTNKQQQIIFGMSTHIVAKDAVSLSSLNMIATIDASSTVTLYSGVTPVGKVHISNTLPSISGCNYFTNKRTLKLSSPFPKRSSLIGHNSSPYDPKFEEALHTLSPVGGNCGRPSTFLDNSLIDSSLVGFKEAVGNKITLEYGNKALYRVALPTASTSPLVTNCLQALKSVLQRDLAMQLLVKWYSARNAPGPQDYSSNQEWHLFIVVLFTLLGYDVDRLQLVRKNDNDYQKEKSSPIVVPKKAKTTNSGSNNDWSYLLQSEEHQKTKDHLVNVLHLTKFVTEKQEDVKKVSEPENIGKINTQAILFPHLPLVLFSLHLLYEELKLNSVMEESLPFLAQLLYQLSSDLNLTWYSYYYFIDFPTHCSPSINFSQISSKDLQKITFPNFIPSKPPSIFEMINNLVKGSEVPPFPYLMRVNSRTKNIIQLVALLAHEFRSNAVELDKFVKLIIPAGSRVDYQDTGLKEKDVCKKIEKPVTDQIVFMYYELGMKKEDLNLLPTGIALMIKDVMHRCRERPPPNWPTEAYELVDRQDLAALEKHLNATKSDIEPGKNSTIKDPEQDDGMNFDDTILKLRFNKDHRVAELRRMLNSSKPVRIAITQRPEVSDHDFIEEQERHLCAVCARTMALPVARGMFTLRTSTPIITEQLPIPRLCLTGKTALRGTTIELGHIDVPPNMNLWPLFHNGVAAGLRIHPDASDIDSTWIVYNKQQQSECGIEHSGFLMALGLNGHLKKLAPFSLYEYLVECHETTNVGLLLGLSATHRGTMDVSMTKLLSLHVETLLPPTSIELNVQQNVQVAALMGVGLVYEGTAHRHIAHALLSEIGRPPGPEMKNCVDRESYSLAAGLALGLVVLGRESEPDLGNIPDTLHYYMVGGNVRPFTGAQKEKYKSPSYQIREGDSINIDVTSPGATVALGLMYFNSGNRAVAEWMRAPGTQFLLDFVRPDLLLLRILARSLILWNEIEPTKAWVSSHVPDIVYEYRLQKPTPEITQHVDLETMNQAYCNIIAGACMALGLKYAGSANENAFKTLFSYTQMFTALLHKSIGELAGKSTIETCLNVTLLSCAVVMAGTGNLEIMRICRQIRTRVGPASSVVTYGSHLATHMALGLTFLGGGRYTLSNSPSAVAALIISLFPKFPTHSNDNRYHLQALRHLYVLAAQPRLILPKDIDSKQYCYATVRLTFKSDKLARGQKVILKAPCLLPQLESLEKVELKDERYWEIVFERGHNWKLLEGMLSKCDSLDVKQRAGCLSYMEDPHGFRSLVAQTLTTEDVIPWAARHEYVTSFTSDKTVLNIVQYFLKKLTEPISEINKSKISKNRSRRSERSNKTLSDTFGLDKSYDYSEKMDISEGASSSMKTVICNNVKNENQDVSESEQYFLQTMALIVYECIIKDKVNLLPLWVNLYKSTDIIEKYPSSHLIWQIKLVSSYMLLKNQLEKSNALLSSESVLAIEQKVALIINSWDEELKPLLNNYLTTGTIDANPELLKKFTTYCTFFDIPYHQSYELAKINPIMKALFHRIGRFPTNIT